jgi:hypothetical protein
MIRCAKDNHFRPQRLDISSVGKKAGQAKSRLREAVSLFIEEVARLGTLVAILEESGFERRDQTYRPRVMEAASTGDS